MTESDSGDGGLQSLSVDECVELLAGRSVGRLAVNIEGDGPLVTPVNYVWSGSAVVFRTDPGTKLDALAHGPISFQVDEIDPIHRSGWSVLVRGTSRECNAFRVQPPGARAVGRRRQEALVPDRPSYGDWPTDRSSAFRAAREGVPLAPDQRR